MHSTGKNGLISSTVHEFKEEGTIFSFILAIHVLSYKYEAQTCNKIKYS